MVKDFTEIQKQIITTDKAHVLVSSAAASGKTQTLVGRIKYLLENGVPPEEIVTITFTNNAASVMYKRLGYPNGLFIGTVHSYCNYLLRGGAIDTTKIIKEERFNDLFEEIKQNPDCLKHVTHLIVDECMDCSQQQFEFFELINPDNYMYFYDYRQSIFSFSGAYPDYLIQKEHDDDVTVYSMRQNFRDGNSYHVVEGNYFPSEAVDSLINNSERLGLNWGDWFVLCRTNADIELFRSLFEKKNVPTDTFKQADLTNSQIEKKLQENTVKILTVHSAKGLEAPCVLSYNIRAYNDEEARLCYVSATRARDFLIWAKMPPKKKKKKKTIVNWE